METNHFETDLVKPVKARLFLRNKVVQNAWFAIRLKYIKAEKFASLLPTSLGKCFVPPVVTNLVFIYSDYKTLWNYRTFNLNGSHMGFMRDQKTWEPVTVRDRDMEIFMRICGASKCPIVMTEKPSVRLGDFVRVTDGPFKGAEGYVVRIRKSKRVMIDVGSLLWVATDYISPDLLETIPKEESGAKES